MTTTTRQNNLILAEDWKRVYQTFKNADFKSYDFENLRRVMLTYLREKYPEDFNDYIESSEYLALIDLVAFLGQSLAFRVDLASRENFIELAERKESVLRLARMLAYNAKRNTPASGLLKFDTVSTTENILDSNGKNLARSTIVWNDSTNSNWYEQFIKVLNAAMVPNVEFGKNQGSSVIDGLNTEQYRFNTTNTDVPIFTFNKVAASRNNIFEIISTSIKDSDAIYEEAPLPGNQLGFIFKNDGKGAGSANTGFFLMFKEGSLELAEFSIEQPVPNEKVAINAENINNDDVWLYSLTSDGIINEQWTQVPALLGNNIAYNSIKNNVRNLYTVITRANDNIDLSFSDGVYGNLPQGAFRCYYRTSNGLSYSLSPSEMRGINVAISYKNKLGVTHTLTVGLSLKTTVSNSAAAEDIESIRTKAPAIYYTQNRMITGEDYNLAPLSASQNLLKVKSINRVSSGISRNFDILDASGKYSKINVFADDGLLYRKDLESAMTMSFANKNDILNFIRNKIVPIFASKSTYNFYLSKYDKIPFTEGQTDTSTFEWVQVTNDINSSTGYFKSNTRPLTTGSYTINSLRYLEPDSLVKLIPPIGKAFKKGKMVTYNATDPEQTLKIWTNVISVIGDGTAAGKGILANNKGPIEFNEVVPGDAVNGYAIVGQILPKFISVLSKDLETELIDLIFANKNFGLRYDLPSRSWKIISESNLDLTSNFSLARTGNTSGTNLDASWIISFVFNGEQALIRNRFTEYVFESLEQNRFFFESSQKIFDTKTKKVIKDQILVLGVNKAPNRINQLIYDIPFEITSAIQYDDGYQSTASVNTTFFDSDNDGIIDNPDSFEDIVGTLANNTTLPNSEFYKNRYLIFKEVIDVSGAKTLQYIDNSSDTVLFLETEEGKNPINYADGQLIYFYNSNEDVIKRVSYSSVSFVLEPNYVAYYGRDNLKFQYIHNANVDRRIDPSASNLIDIYLLTKTYDSEFRNYLSGGLEIMPEPPSIDQLKTSYGSELSKIKAISDEVIYHHAKYKVLFGGIADSQFQVRFKVVKNPVRTVNDNELKVAIINSINRFFSVENWDFGDKFYFTELSSYIVDQNSPNISNIVIVPKQSTQVFGSLFEIQSQSDEIFVSGATVDDIDIVTEINAAQINALGTVITSTSV